MTRAIEKEIPQVEELPSAPVELKSELASTAKKTDEIAPIAIEGAKPLLRSQSPMMLFANIVAKTEGLTSSRVKKYSDEHKQNTENSNLLGKIKADLSALPENTKELPVDIINQFDALKNKGINLWNGSKKIDKNGLEGLKSAVTSRIEMLKSDNFALVTTKIQRCLGDIQSILTTVQDTMRKYNQLIKKVCDLSVSR